MGSGLCVPREGKGGKGRGGGGERGEGRWVHGAAIREGLSGVTRPQMAAFQTDFYYSVH